MKPSSKLLAMCLFLAASCAPTQAGDERYALLIANQAYDASVGRLKNPHNDIALVAEALKAQRFDVLPPVKDAGRSAILGAVRGLAGKLKSSGPGALGFIYYSGHGAAEKDTGINYIIPVDAKDPGTTTFWDESIKLDDIMRLLEGTRSAAKFVVFDACRNELQLPSRDSSKGLLPLPEQQGFFVAYASAPGRTASDRGDSSGPYAAALAGELRRHGLDHLNLFQNVKEAVIAATGGVQHPWESNGLTRRVYLTGEPTTPADMALWESVRTTGDAPSLQRYLDRFPHGVFAATALQMLDRLRQEDAQREAARQFEVERKAQEARQTAALQRALADADGARAAVAEAEGKRAAAEAAAALATQALKAASNNPELAQQLAVATEDARKAREALARAERLRAAAEAAAASAKQGGGIPASAGAAAKGGGGSSRVYFTDADRARIAEYATTQGLKLPAFDFGRTPRDADVGAKRFVGVWGSDDGYRGSHRSVMLIITSVDRQGRARGFHLLGASRPSSYVKGPAASIAIAGPIDGDVLKYNLGSRGVVSEAAMTLQNELVLKDTQPDGRAASARLRPLWRLVDAEGRAGGL